MPSFSSAPVAKKLGIKSGNRIAILYSPRGYTSILAKLPTHVSVTTRLAGEPFDLVQAFYRNEQALRSDLRKIIKAIYPWGKVWICWRKGGVTDLDRDLVVKMGERVNLDAVASCAIDGDWSALKFMLPKGKRKPSQGF